MLGNEACRLKMGQGLCGLHGSDQQIPSGTKSAITTKAIPPSPPDPRPAKHRATRNIGIDVAHALPALPIRREVTPKIMIAANEGDEIRLYTPVEEDEHTFSSKDVREFGCIKTLSVSNDT